MSSEVLPLASWVNKGAKGFEGAGIYAIYYFGDFDLYQRIANDPQRQSLVQPIYIGKADPKGGRKGDLELDAGIGTALFDRLREHAKSINDAENIEVEDFSCRCLVVDEVWIGLAERLAIRRYLPIWNTLIDGFGNHDPGGRRATQYKSDWDVIHPGRRWAKKLAIGPTTTEQIRRKVETKHSTEELAKLADAALSEDRTE
jgi:hypothetical protein